MHHPTLEYLAWARRVYGAVRFDLGSSNVLAPTLADLGYEAERLSLHGDHRVGPPALRQAVAEAYDTTPERVFCGAGAAGVGGCLYRALLDPGDRVLTEVPGYEPLWRVPEGLGARVELFERPLDAGAPLDVPAIVERLSPGTKLVVVTNLHNPSGRRAPESALRALGEAALAVGALVVVDEVYLDFMGAGTPPAASMGPPFISINSVTKVLGLGSVRIGWALAEPGIVDRCYEALAHDTCNLPSPSVDIAIAALSRRAALIEATRARLLGNQRIVEDWAAGREDVTFNPPDGGQVGWLRFRDPDLKGMALVQHLLEHHETVMGPGDFFRDPNGARLGFGAHEEQLREGLRRVGLALEELAG